MSASAQNGALAYAYEYDALGRRTAEQLSYTGLSAAVRTQFTYDLADRIEQITRGTATQPTVWVSGAVRDANGLITAIEDRRGTPVDIVDGVVHVPFGPHQNMTFGNGRQVTRALDQRYRVSGSQVPSVESQTLTWSPDDNLAAASISGVHSGAQQFDYTHDDLNRVRQAVELGFGQEELEYDQNGQHGNLTFRRTTVGGQTFVNNTFSYASATNRMVEFASFPVTLDASGNLIAGGPQHAYRYDSLGQLRVVDLAWGPPDPNFQSRYAFNHLGERASKEVGFYPSGTESTLFTYLPDGKLLGETLFSDNVLAEQRDYVWMGDTPVAMHATKFGAGGTITADETYYLHADHLNTPRRATNGAGDTVWLFEELSSIHGEGYVSYWNGGPISEINLRFSGQYYDQDADLNYNYHRHYWPHAGRYVQPDPIGLAGGLNTYLYANGNPLRYVDPEGLATAVLVGGPTTSNPFGHIAIATSGRGVYSYGTSHPFGSSTTEYLRDQATYRGSLVIVLNTTPEQEAAIVAAMTGYPSTPYDVISHSCATAVRDALFAADVDFDWSIYGERIPALNTPAGMSELAMTVPGAKLYRVPRGAGVPAILEQFNPL